MNLAKISFKDLALFSHGGSIVTIYEEVTPVYMT
jgi:hypothetical protein